MAPETALSARVSYLREPRHVPDCRLGESWPDTGGA